MGLTKAWRLSFLALCPVISLTGLLVVSFAGPEPQKKPPPFPLNLFAQATAEDYVDEQACVECHSAAHVGFERSPHAPYVRHPGDPVDRRGCQSCHGPGGPHIAHLEEAGEILKYVLSYTKSKPMESAQGCLRCHNDTMTMAHWRRTGHAQADVTCSDCHKIHQEPEREKPDAKFGERAKNARSLFFVAVAEPRKLLKSDEVSLCGKCHPREVNELRHNFHHPIPEGQMVCSDCHAIHPRRAVEKQSAGHTRVRSAKETCVICHAETAGPFVFEHDPVAGLTGEGCTECHRPHGSHNPKLLTTFSRGLCNQCHTDQISNHFPGRTCWQSGCHVGVHGSHTDRLLLRR